jgi:pyruvate,water dikinase
VNPDEWMVFKPTLKRGKRPIIERRLGSKELRMVYVVGGSKMVKNQLVPPQERGKFSLSDDEVLELARWACVIEDHYSQLHGKWTPMDIEWAKDGATGQLFVVQARPETVSLFQRHGLIGARSRVARILISSRATCCKRRGMKSCWRLDVPLDKKLPR